MVRFLKQIGISVIIVVLGAWVALTLARSRKPPERVTQENPGPLVEIYRAEKQDIPVTVHGNGTVRAEVLVQVVPEVSGKIIRIHPGLKRFESAMWDY